MILLLYPVHRIHLFVSTTGVQVSVPGFTCIILGLPVPLTGTQGLPASFPLTLLLTSTTEAYLHRVPPPLVPTATAHWCAQDLYDLCSADVGLFCISLPELPLSVGQVCTGLLN